MSTSVPTDKDRIEYLILRRYPGARMLKFPPSLSASIGSRGCYPDTRELKANVGAYRAQLSTLPLEELRALYSQERNREAEALKRRAEEQERSLPFNQPHAVADFQHWSRAAHFTLDEAIALSLGKAPEVVSWDTVKAHVQLSPFAYEYARRRDLALRAAQWQELFDPVLPGIFWLGANGSIFRFLPSLRRRLPLEAFWLLIGLSFMKNRKQLPKRGIRNGRSLCESSKTNGPAKLRAVTN
jgi:hypothetical protein